MTIQCIITDIEGTTTSVSFVFDVLFPYFRENLPRIRDRVTESEIAKILEQVQQIVLDETGEEIEREGAIAQLHQWSVEDRKIAPLKSLQGLLWEEGYKSGAFQSHLYEDVLPNLQQWQQQGIKLGVYSSGSEYAQKLLFGYTTHGDLTPYFDWFFDLKIGSKKVAESYQKIVEAVDFPASDILFLSDVEAELDAAQESGLATIQLVRSGTVASQKHRTVTSFDEITTHF